MVRIISAGEGCTVSTDDEFAAALLAAQKNNSSLTIIDVKLEKYDCYERLKRLTDKLTKREKQNVPDTEKR